MKSILMAAIAALFFASLATEAEAKMSNTCTYDNNGRVTCMGPAGHAQNGRSYTKRRVAKHRSARHRAYVADANGNSAGRLSGFSNSTVVNEARKYIGTNPTGRRSLWCGAFMDLVLKRAGYKGGGNLASAYARYGIRVSGPQIGAIAVMSRRGGGHVGVVSGIDANGNPIIISGNTRVGRGPHTTLEHPYPRSRIYAYVMPR